MDDSLIKTVSAQIYRVMSAYVDEAPFADAELEDCINLQQICDVLSERVVAVARKFYLEQIA